MLQISQGMDGDRSSDFRAVGKGREKEWMRDELEPRKTMFKVERDAGPPFRSLRHQGRGPATSGSWVVVMVAAMRATPHPSHLFYGGG